MKKLGILLYVYLILVIFLSCSKDQTPLCPADGEFVMDSYNYNATVKTNPDNDSLWCFLLCSFTYHFEKIPGNVLRLTLEVKGYDCVMKFWNVSKRTAPGVIRTMLDSIWINNDMEGADSLYIKIELSGVFGVNDDCMEGFEWKQSSTVPVEKG